MSSQSVQEEFARQAGAGLAAPVEAPSCMGSRLPLFF